MFLGTDIQFLCEQRGSAMLRPDLQEERSAAQREGPSAEGASLVPLQDSDVVRASSPPRLLLASQRLCGGMQDTT